MIWPPNAIAGLRGIVVNEVVVPAYALPASSRTLPSTETVCCAPNARGRSGVTVIFESLTAMLDSTAAFGPFNVTAPSAAVTGSEKVNSTVVDRATSIAFIDGLIVVKVGGVVSIG